MHKKASSIVFIFILLSQTFLTSLGMPLTVQAMNGSPTIFTDVKLVDDKNDVIDAKKNQDKKVDQQATITVEYEWALEPLQAKEGDIYSFALPSELMVVKEQVGPLMTDQKVEVGSLRVGKDGKGKIQFTKAVEDITNARGTFSIQTQLDEKVASQKEVISLTFITVEGNKIIDIPLISEEIHSKSAKVEEGKQLTAQKENPEQKVEEKPELKPEEKPEEKKKEPVEITENILTNMVLKDEKDNIIDAEKNPDLLIKLGSKAKIEYEWELENNHGYVAGSTFTFKLPDLFEVHTDLKNEKLMLDGVQVGTFTVTTDRTVTMTFNEEIEKRSNVHGNIALWTEFKSVMDGNTEKDIVVPIKDGKVIKTPIRFQPKDVPSISKKGEPNKRYNATEITWTVDLNKQLKKIDQAVLRDPIEAGQALQANSIKVYELNVDIDGTVSEGNLIDPSEYEIGKINGQDFQLNFKSPTIRDAYRVVYKTDITDGEQKTFNNKATLSGQNFTEVSVDARVDVGRGTPLDKKSIEYDAKNQVIKWEVKYNYNEKTIAQQDAILKDLFSKSQHFVEGSLNIYKIPIDENGNEKPNEKELVPPHKYQLVPITTDVEDGFTIQFLEDISAAYKIEYKTKADERVFKEETVKNKVSTNGISKEGSQQIQQGILKKHNTTTNYKDKTTNWRITFNEDYHEMTNVKLTDVFPNKGLTLIPTTLKIIRDGNVTLKPGTDYVLDETNFTITFTHPITEKHEITYTTSFDYEARENKGEKKLPNKATLEWIDSSGRPQTKDATADFIPDNHTVSNGYKRGSYDATTKEITWNIGINYNLLKIKNATVEDFLLSDQELVPNSLKVYDMDINGQSNGGSNGKTELILDQDYTITEIQDKDGNKGFRISFLNEIDSPYDITYKTSLKGKHIQDVYRNTATLRDGDTTLTNLTADVPIPHGDVYVSKSGAQQKGQRLIDWKVEINYGQSEVHNAKLIDNPSPNQLLLEDTFHLYETTVDAAGKVTKGKELTKEQDYKLVIHTNDEGHQYFEVSFPNTINSAYMLEYQSYITASDNEQVTNEVSFEGEQIKTGKKDSQGSVTVKVTSGSGTGSGKTGALQIVKVDAATGEKLKGASFTLYNEDETIAIRKITTDAEGKAVIKNLLYGDYVLKEDMAPEGYVVSIGKQKINFTEAKSVHEIKNKKIIRAVELRKVDKHDKTLKLQGVKFNLLDDKGNIVRADLVTDEHGKIFIDELNPGTYKFVETQELEHYKKNPKEYEFTIEEKQTEIDIVTVENELISGAVELTKVDKDNGANPLTGASFNLLNSKGQTIRRGLPVDANGKLIISDLQPGEYSLVETKAPKDYVLDKTPIKFTIEKSQIEIVKVVAENELTPATIELTKVDKDDKAIKLAGAEFSLYSQDDTLLQSGLKTEDGGILSIPNLKPGTYKLIETKAPEHYELDGTPILFTVERGGAKVSVTAENKLTPGSVELTKVDADKNDITLVGAEFKVEDAAGNVVKEKVTTGENGKIEVTDLRPGIYKFIETKAPEHYTLDETPIEFEISKSQTEIKKVTAENKLIPGSAELTKVDKDKQEIVLKDAEFRVEDEAGNVVREKITTGDDGKVEVTDLRPGIYYFIETKAPIGYELDESPIKFVIEKGQTEKAVVEATNKIIPGSVELMKVDEDKQDVVLKDAVFKIVDKDGNVVREKVTTGENGKVEVTDLRPGTYYFIETIAPFGYELDTTSIEFVIEQEQKEIIRVKAENKIIPGAVELTKVDKDDHEMKLVGAEFKVVDEDGNVVKEKVTTGEGGKVEVTDLRPGTYKFIETKAPEHYTLDETPIEFDISKSQTEVKKVTAENKLISGAVELTKVDKDDYEVKLVGAEFKVVDEDGNVVKEKVTTGEGGKVEVTDLRPGRYKFIETKAPEHYTLDETPIEFEISKSQTEVKKVIAENKIIPGAVELTKVDKDDHEVRLVGAEFKIVDEDGNVVKEKVTTGEGGKVEVTDLRPGIYKLIETKAPEHYTLDETPIEFEISKSQTEVKKVIAENELVPGSVELTKIDQDDKKTPLEGAKFRLERKLKDGKVEVISKEEITDVDGKIKVENLTPGDYQFVETEAPTDYALNETPLGFEIVRSQQEMLHVSFENELARGAVQLIKVDSYDEAEKLQDAEFKLLDSTGKVVEPEIRKTDENGSIIVENLKPGNYTFIETKAPFGYELDDTEISFEVVRGQKEMLILPVHPNTLIPGTVELTKVSTHSNATLANAEFELQDSTGEAVVVEGKSTFITDENGKITVPGLRPGTYQFVETKAPNGYHLDTTPIVFTIDKGQIVTKAITAKNTLITGSVELTKVDKDNKEIKLQGVEFRLQDMAGNVLQSGLMTNEAGVIVISGLVPGDYQFVETKASFGYQLDGTPIKFTVVGSQETVVTVENELIPSEVELTKVDVENNEITLANAEFELQDQDGNTLATGFTTNDQGKIVVPNLKPGKYQFVETKAPFGYELDETPIEFVIEKGQTKATTVTAENELSTGTVELTKVDVENNEITLADAEFELQNQDGNTLATGFTTNDQGKIVVPNLKPGKYQFVETKAPFGYELDETPIEFVIEKGQTKATTVTAENKLSTGTVELTKVDRHNHEVVLAGAEFALQDGEGNILKSDLTTDKNGKIIVDGLKPGEYQFVETKAPTGYEIDVTQLRFTIEKGQTEHVTVIAENAKTSYPEEKEHKPDGETKDDEISPNKTPDGGLPNTSTNIFNMMLAGIGLLFLGVGFFFRRKKV
ncbi:SpaA isopeptide-forming pilin-related protein [Priestia taiwanensis]|uniref:Collagen-binding protein n=1 Tax=Priestia taiwanensis TaxID=1347902 RepID=A0A917AYR9_9BACI|nr:SpaA isopeptide-forming pilin-related protein [Priestia taiwanensis]MBM7364888.1 LPXTG-motif cell wall-anchored protein [Priestia taiwanensis]GGE82877.1 hypothetical protein GCM10007140_35530 [Priestia taiwanensis]